MAPITFKNNRMEKYRERLKSDPEKWKQHLEKEKERNKIRRLKLKERELKEENILEENRKKNRKRVRLYRQRKKQGKFTDTEMKINMEPEIGLSPDNKIVNIKVETALNSDVSNEMNVETEIKKEHVEIIVPEILQEESLSNYVKYEESSKCVDREICWTYAEDSETSKNHQETNPGFKQFNKDALSICEVILDNGSQNESWKIREYYQYEPITPITFKNNRMEKYREKLRSDPDKWREHLNKEKQRNKARRLKAKEKELNEKDMLEKNRKKNRERVRLYRQRKKQVKMENAFPDHENIDMVVSDKTETKMNLIENVVLDCSSQDSTFSSYMTYEEAGD